MVFAIADETVVLFHETDTFLDTILPELEVDHHAADNIDWLAEEHDDEDDAEVSPFASDALWGGSMADSLDDADEEFDLLMSGSSSPSNDFASFDESSSEQSSEALRTRSKRMAKRKADSDDDFKVKKAKPAKRGPPRKNHKARASEDDTLKTITQLRADGINEPESRRKIHNVLERKRRNDLKFCYRELRDSIPDLEKTDRTPTGTILCRAAEYIQQLQDEETKLAQAMDAARAENERLRQLLDM